MRILTSGIGLIFNGPPTQFTWSTIARAQNYILVMGSTRFGTNVINSGLLPATQSRYSNFPPLSRNMIYYVTLLTKVNGQWAFYTNVLGT